MKQRHNVEIGISGETVNSGIKIKQFDVKSHEFLVKIYDSSISTTDKIKISIHNGIKTLDIFKPTLVSVQITPQEVLFTLTEASLYYSGLILLEINVFSSDDTLKWTSCAIAVDVIKSAPGNVQDIDIESSLSSELLNIARKVNGKVDKYQGYANAGKYLAVNDRGYVTLVDPPQGGGAEPPYAVLTASHNTLETDTNYEILPKSEVEI